MVGHGMAGWIWKLFQKDFKLFSSNRFKKVGLIKKKINKLNGHKDKNEFSKMKLWKLGSSGFRDHSDHDQSWPVGFVTSF